MCAHLTEVTVRALKPTGKQIKVWDSTTPGFGVIIGKSKSFFVMYGRKRAVKVLGRFPDTPLAAARSAAKKLLAANPRPEVALSFREALELFIDEKAKARRPRTVQNLHARLTRHFGFTRLLADVTHEDILRKLGAIDTNAEYDHALSVAKTFFTWAHNHRYIHDNPIRGITPRGMQSRSRVLSDEELCKIWRVCEQRGEKSESLREVIDPSSDLKQWHDKSLSSLPTNFARIVQLLILTGMRRTECASLQFSWIQNDTITLRKEMTKNGREHVLPLGSMTSTILTKMAKTSGSSFIFQARGKETPFCGWSKSKAALDKASGVRNYTLHDIRRTYRTIHARIGTPPHIAERLVNHISSRTAVEQIYDRHSYMEPMREAVKNFEAWFSELIK